MKIKWLLDTREVPGMGVFATGEIREVDKNLGEQLIKQKAAVKVSTSTAKKEIE